MKFTAESGEVCSLRTTLEKRYKYIYTYIAMRAINIWLNGELKVQVWRKRGIFFSPVLMRFRKQQMFEMDEWRGLLERLGKRLLYIIVSRIKMNKSEYRSC